MSTRISVWAGDSVNVHLYFELNDEMIHLEVSDGNNYVNIALPDALAKELEKALSVEGHVKGYTVDSVLRERA